MGGNNNNSTCRQFRSSYKKLITHVNAIVPNESNCTLHDATRLFKIEETIQPEHDENLSFLINFEHDYTGCNKWCWNGYNSEVVMYIAGAIIRSLKKTLKCDICIECLESNTVHSDLQKIKNRADSKNNRKVLLSPAADVINICKTAKKVLRSKRNLVSTKNLIPKLLIYTKMLLVSLHLFNKMGSLIEESIIDSHKDKLINNIIKKYLNIRLYYERQTSLQNVKRI